MPNSLKSKLKKFVHNGLLKEEDLKRIIVIPPNATNSEVLEKVFPMSEIIFDGLQEGYINFCMVSNPETMNCISKEWWNAKFER